MLDSVKKAFVLGIKALKLFYVIAAINIVANIINVLVIPAPVDAEMSTAKSFAVIGITILFAVAGIFVYGGVLAYIKELIKTGSANLASFLDNAKKYFLRLLAVSAVVFLIFLVVTIALTLALGFLPAALRIIIGILVMLVLAVLFIMPPYALVANDLGIVESIKKGALAGKNNFLKILGILALIFLVGITIMILASIISGILSFLLRPIASFIAAIVMAVAGTILWILMNIAYMDFYLRSAAAEVPQPSAETPQP